jgi:hypothetical protein
MGDEMKRKRIIGLFFFVVLILVFSSCHPRYVSDVKPNMTKEEVVSLWGNPGPITYKNVNGRSIETWEYYFSNSDSICWVNFLQDKVVASECRPRRRGWFWYH